MSDPSPTDRTTRELFNDIMGYRPFDRMPVFHWAGWDETRRRWINEGLPTDQTEFAFFNAEPFWNMVNVEYNLVPRFEQEVFEETEQYRVYRDPSGVIKKEWLDHSGIPQYLDFTLKGAEDWQQYKSRLQPDPVRFVGDLDHRIKQAESNGLPVGVGTAPMMGWIRNWMGVENMSYLMYDRPNVYADMVDTMAELTCWGIDQVVSHMSRPPDYGFGWEDICGKNGPLVSPAIFDRCVAPGYRKIRRKLESYGVKLLGVDSDGLVEPLIANWLDAGVNLQFPIEIGTWQADPHALRRKFGKELRILGGFDKRALAHGRDAIDAEIERRRALMAEGGFIILPDHIIPPDVPLEDYMYYLDRVRELRF